MFISTRKIWYALSSVLVLGSILAFSVWGLKLGLEFSGGTLAEYQVSPAPVAADVATLASAAGAEAPQVVPTGSGVIVRAKGISSDAHKALADAMKKKYPSAVEVRFESIGPSISAELRSKAVTAVIATLILIMLYIAWSFRKVGGRIQSWKYGVVVALSGLHDAIIPVGVFSVLGHFGNFEVDSAFVAAILTILGYSINDTIVVFDRVRENLLKTTGTIGEVVEHSIRQTVARSINTSLTVVLSLLSVYFFGGASTKSFALALTIGVVVGTYSSIFIAAPMLVDWQKK